MYTVYVYIYVCRNWYFLTINHWKSLRNTLYILVQNTVSYILIYWYKYQILVYTIYSKYDIRDWYHKTSYSGHVAYINLSLMLLYTHFKYVYLIFCFTFTYLRYKTDYIIIKFNTYFFTQNKLMILLLRI